MTANGGLAASYDANPSQVSSACATKHNANTAFIGRTFANPERIFKILVRGSSDVGFAPNGVLVLGALYGSNAVNPPTISTAGQQLGNVGTYCQPGEEAEIISNDQITAFKHVWFEPWKIDGAPTSLHVAQLTIIGAQGSAVAAPRVLRNYILNPEFRLWPRGESFTGFTSGNGKYTADHWLAHRSGNVGGMSCDWVFGPKGSPQRAIRVRRNTGDTSTAALNIIQRLSFEESTFYLRGKIVTLSFPVKVGTDFSGIPDMLSVSVYESARHPSTASRVNDGVVGLDVVGDHWFNSVVYDPQNDWQKAAKLTFRVPLTTQSLDIRTRYYPSGTAGANDWMAMGEVQLVEGYAVPSYVPRPRDDEVRLCAADAEIIGS